MEQISIKSIFIELKTINNMNILLGILAILLIIGFFFAPTNVKDYPDPDVKEDYPDIKEEFFETIPTHYFRKKEKFINIKKLSEKKILSYNWEPIYE